MRIMANENVPGPVVAALRSAGHDVVWSKETLPEQRTVRYSRVREAEARLVVTFDKDFGELAVRSRVPASGGVVLFRLHGSNPEVDNARAVAALTSRDDWAGHFAVVTDDRVRLRRLPRPR